MPPGFRRYGPDTLVGPDGRFYLESEILKSEPDSVVVTTSGNTETSSPSMRAADIHPQPVEWLWQGRIAFGMQTTIAGFPGVGKSTLLYDLAARTTREGKAVVIVTAEDHLAAVVRPRLEAAEANLELVHIVIVPITLPESVELLAGLVREHNAALLILDPLVAFIGEAVNSHRDHHVRRVLAPLGDLAEMTGAAVVCVVHTNKGSDTEPLMRISGSIGFTGAARSVLLAATDPEDESRRILAVVKSNLAEFPPPLAYRLEGATLEGGINTSRVTWLGEAPEVDIRRLLTARDADERTDHDAATELLRETGVLEHARPARDLEADAKALGIGEKTLQRARRTLQIPAWKDGFPGVWYWGPRPDTDLDKAPTGHPRRSPDRLFTSTSSEVDKLGGVRFGAVSRSEAPPAASADPIEVAVGRFRAAGIDLEEVVDE